MYAVAERLDPDTYLALARATYAEMALAGVTCVGEFHYLHHRPDGGRYDDPNAMGLALVQAAREAGLRIALLDTCYLAGGIGAPLSGVQRRFGDGDAAGWAERADALRAALSGASDVVVGAAVHSVRAVPADQIAEVVGVGGRHGAAPLHCHLSEQPAENERAWRPTASARPGCCTTTVSSARGRPRSTRRTSSDEEVALLGASATYICLCPSTERDLADGIGPARLLRDAGSPITLGSDSHALIDLFEEARAVELDERLASGVRGTFSTGQLLDAATMAGHASLGFPDAGRLAPGASADLVAVRLDSVRTAGGTPDSAADRVVFAATASDVTDVVASGRRVVESGRHVLGDVARLLADAIG